MVCDDFIRTLVGKPYYDLVLERFAGRTARRSGIPYMAHISEGAYLLHCLFAADEDTVAAFCVHPLFQSDRHLMRLMAEQSAIDLLPRRAIVLAMEHRRYATAYGISDPVREPERIEIGFLPEAWQMLAADKIQNKKDFMRHVYKSNSRDSFLRVSEQGERYFNSWLIRLGVTDDLHTKSLGILKADEEATQ